MLHYECKRKNIPFPKFLYNFFDLKQLYAESTKTYKTSLKKMVENLNLQMVGHHHSGIDDCQTISLVLGKLLQSSFIFSPDHLITFDHSYDPISTNDFVLFNTKPIIPDGFNLDLSGGITNLPRNSNQQDVISFLHPIQPTKIFIEPNGRRAFFETASKSDLTESCKKNKTYKPNHRFQVFVEPYRPLISENSPIA